MAAAVSNIFVRIPGKMDQLEKGDALLELTKMFQKIDEISMDVMGKSPKAKSPVQLYSNKDILEKRQIRRTNSCPDLESSNAKLQNITKKFIIKAQEFLNSCEDLKSIDLVCTFVDGILEIKGRFSDTSIIDDLNQIREAFLTLDDSSPDSISSDSSNASDESP